MAQTQVGQPPSGQPGFDVPPATHTPDYSIPRSEYDRPSPYRLPSVDEYLYLMFNHRLNPKDTYKDYADRRMANRALALQKLRLEQSRHRREYSGFVDRNHNGIDDRLEPKRTNKHRRYLRLKRKSSIWRL